MHDPPPSPPKSVYFEKLHHFFFVYVIVKSLSAMGRSDFWTTPPPPSQLNSDLDAYVDVNPTVAYSLMAFRLPGQHYNGDESLPVYEWTTTIKCPAEILEILLKPIDDTLVCRKVPTAIRHNVCFLLDRSSLKSENDWKCDDLGSWKNNGVQRHRFCLDEGEVLPVDVDDPLQEGIKYIVKRTYFKNNSAPDLKKCASFIEGEKSGSACASH